MCKKAKKIPVEVEFTEGYQTRFTEAILRIYSNRMQRAAEADSSNTQQAEVNVS